jgi:hypothetical protein
MNASNRQVKAAEKLLARYATKDQHYRLPINARRFVHRNIDSYSIRRTELAKLDAADLSSLIAQLKRGL